MTANQLKLNYCIAQYDKCRKSAAYTPFELETIQDYAAMAAHYAFELYPELRVPERLVPRV